MTSLAEDERTERLEKLNARLVAVNAVKLKIRKLNAFITEGALRIESPKAMKMHLAVAAKYVQNIEKPPQGVRASLTIIQNELQSFSEGLTGKRVNPTDVTLKACVQAIKILDDIRAKIESNITKLSASDEERIGPDEQLLLKNREAKEKIPPFNGKSFVVCRVPVAFTFANKKHSSVGYLNQEVLDNLGFSTDNLGGYTILHKQLMIGIDPLAAFNREADVENNTIELKRKRVKEPTVVFKKGNPTRVMKSKDVEHIDEARRVLKLMQTKTGVKYAFVSERGVGFNKGEFFWVMPEADINRLARAFPGGANKIDKWGFAF